MKSNAVEETRMEKSFLSRIVIKFQGYFNLPYHEEGEINDFFSQNQILPWRQLLKLFPRIRINKLFTSLLPETIFELVNKAKMVDRMYQSPDFLSYYGISCPGDISMDELLRVLMTFKSVEHAYIQCGPITAPASKGLVKKCMGQGYLNPAPDGIDARYAWAVEGGKGEGKVKFIDIEQGWLLNHEALRVKTLPVTGVNDLAYKDHGAAVLGVIMMQDNPTGSVGITPQVIGHVISQWRPDGVPNDPDAIMAAIDNLNSGDILLLEAQTFNSTTSNKVWPVEIQEATFQVIRLATALGIIVIEAGGNGDLSMDFGNDLDLFTLNKKKILNPVSYDFRDSGAIMVAAASLDAPHHRISFSNYGNRINCYAWGEGVETLGSYPQSSGVAINTYTRNFNGTSSASAIIAGAAIAVQSIMEANHHFRLNPIQMRSILGGGLYGTASANGHLQDKIGVMPDLKKIIDNAVHIAEDFLYRNEPHQVRKMGKSPIGTFSQRELNGGQRPL